MQYPKFENVAKFHGHSCPGLAMGYKLTIAALEKFNKLRAEDEEIVAIVENDACGTDAVQFISGCTFGKGNFIFKDHGKMVYTFICRESGKALRASRKSTFLQNVNKDELTREDIIRLILNSTNEDFARLEEVTIELPPKAKLYKNIVCEECGETAMETRIRKIGGRKLCIPCAENIKKTFKERKN